MENPARWPYLVNLPLSILGFGISGYLTYEHYTASASLACPAAGGAINCLKVTTSSYSRIHGIPVVVLGLVFFAVMVALQSPWSWRSERPGLAAVRMTWSVAGVATALWLVYAELFKLHAICEWCTAVHVLSVVLMVTTLFATAAGGPVPIDDEVEEGEEAAGARPPGRA